MRLKTKSFTDFLSNTSLIWTIGSALCLALLNDVFYLNLSPYTYPALALSVWIWYTIDHVLDSERVTNGRLRYSFHKKNKKELIYILIVATVSLLFCVWQLPSKMLLIGMGLAILCLFYLLLNQKLKWMKAYKEYVASFLVSMGVFLPYYSTGFWEHHWAFASILFLAFLMICLNNLFLFSWFDKEEDIKDGLGSKLSTNTVDQFSIKIERGFVLGFLLNASLLFVSDFHFPTQFKLFSVLSAMQLVLFILYLEKDKDQTKKYYRIWGDGIFVLPVVYFLL